MKLEEIRENIELIDKLDAEITFLDYLKGMGIEAVTIKPSYNPKENIPNEMLRNWMEKELIELMKNRIKALEDRKKVLLRKIGVDE